MNYYERLGVAITATIDEIRKAYRRLAVQMHPDRNPHDAQATEKFQKITEAYSVLIDVEKRRVYDLRMNLNVRKTSRPNNPFKGMEDAIKNFDQMFSNSQVYDLSLTLEDLLIHRYKNVEVQTMFNSFRFRINLDGITLGKMFTYNTGHKDFPQFRVFPQINLLNKYEIYNDYDLKISVTLGKNVFKNGASVRINLVEKTVVEYIDPGITQGSCLVLKNMGLYRGDGTRGNLYVELKYS